MRARSRLRAGEGRNQTPSFQIPLFLILSYPCRLQASLPVSRVWKECSCPFTKSVSSSCSADKRRFHFFKSFACLSVAQLKSFQGTRHKHTLRINYSSKVRATKHCSRLTHPNLIVPYAIPMHDDFSSP